MPGFVYGYRERESLRQFREDEEARQRAEEEARFAPIRETESKLQQTHRALAQLERERLTTATPDEYRWIDDAVGPDVRMTEQQAEEFNRRESRRYREAHPEVYLSPEVIDQLLAYFKKERISLISFLMLEKLVQRFADVGLLPERPEPEPVVGPVIEQPIIPAEPETFVGIDPLTGLERAYTSREIDLMDSTTYRRCFKLTKAALALPSRPLF